MKADPNKLYVAVAHYTTWGKKEAVVRTPPFSGDAGNSINVKRTELKDVAQFIMSMYCAAKLNRLEVFELPEQPIMVIQ